MKLQKAERHQVNYASDFQDLVDLVKPIPHSYY
jgi:hypothetical protein